MRAVYCRKISVGENASKYFADEWFGSFTVHSAHIVNIYCITRKK